MDLGTVIGIVLIVVLLMGAMTMGVGVGAYIDIPSVLIVVGGSIGALMVSFKPSQMKSFAKIFMKAIKPGEEDTGELIKKLVEFATKARKDGILSLEGDVNNEENEFLKKGLSMAIDGSEPDTIRELLDRDPSYVVWCCENLDWFDVDAYIYDLALEKDREQKYDGRFSIY